ncbi:efflux RND transporter periplasmic adaptor subunit [Anatilimnocola floriformis]|uniref:efflux RND transporter periplasmic adaptor subunit n=1 Tax=Anatilimnocola floriformis TaxID=2948575 RepID=UPI0020C3BDD1|nr:efflux RND transporter periplasmic adaptor subunit [Anatilimnocola floriformis]
MQSIPVLTCLTNRAWLWFAAQLLVATIVGCAPPNSFQPPPPPEVLITHPTFQNVTSYIEQTGTAQASELVEVRSRVSGYIKEIKFEDGDLVKADQLLFVIDEEPFSVKLQYARAKKSEVSARLQRAKQSKSREIAKANLDLAKAELEFAQTSHRRMTALVDRKATSQAEYDQTEAALQKASAQVVAARAEQDQAETSFESDILVAEAALALAVSEERSAEIDLDYCRIKAPFSGLIDRRAVDVGNYIAMDASTVLSRIVQVDPIYAYASINQADLIRLRTRSSTPGAESSIPVTVGVDESKAAPLAGVVDYIAPSVHQGTGTVQIRGIFKNAGVITPGMFVRLRIPAEVVEGAVLVPERSLGYDQAGTYVYVVNLEQKIERRSVTAGDLVEGKRVIRGAIDAEDQIVADGLLKVRPEMKVTTKWLETRTEEKRAAQNQAPPEHAKHASAGS